MRVRYSTPFVSSNYDMCLTIITMVSVISYCSGQCYYGNLLFYVKRMFPDNNNIFCHTCVMCLNGQKTPHVMAGDVGC